VENARSWGTTESEKRYYEWNAKNILTLWGPAQSGCYQYAQRQWSGLLKGYYDKRWEKALKAQRNSIKTGKPLDEQAFLKELREWEDEWGHQNVRFQMKPQGETVKIARKLWERYRSEIHSEDKVASPAELP